MKNDRRCNRFAVSVNRKIGSAVKRNYIKRALKEWFRLNQHLVSGNRTYDCWIVVKQKFERTDMPEIKQLLTSVLEKINRK